MVSSMGGNVVGDVVDGNVASKAEDVGDNDGMTCGGKVSRVGGVEYTGGMKVGEGGVEYSLWSPEFSESVDRQSIHQLVATYKTNKKTTVVFRRPSDDKVSLILKDFELRVTIISIQDLVPFFM